MHELDLIIVGTGSGNSIPGPEFDDWNIAIVEKGVFGGTCLNVGCIPSKMFVYSADVAETIHKASAYGIDATLNGTDWPAIRDRVFNRIDPIAAGGEAYRRSDESANIAVFGGEGYFTGHKTLEVKMADGSTEQLTGRHIVIGAGGRPFVPPYPGIESVEHHTSDSIMRLEALPEHLIVMGGGYIATELGHVFQGLGSKVTVINRSERLLRREDDDISARFTEVFGRRANLCCGATVNNISQEGRTISVDITIDGVDQTIEGDALLVATGRVPNGDLLHLGESGIEQERGRVLVDENFRTNVDGVWAFGDIANELQLKHLANAEVRTLRQNILRADGQLEGPLETIDSRFVPHAVFSDPQVATVGLTERDAREQGLDIVVATKDFGSTAYGWAMEDTDGFCKVIADASTRRLLGAHILGAQSSILIQSLIQGMHFDLTVDQMAHGQYYIHPALTEVVENALLDL